MGTLLIDLLGSGARSTPLILAFSRDPPPFLCQVCQMHGYFTTWLIRILVNPGREQCRDFDGRVISEHTYQSDSRRVSVIWA